MRVLKNGAFCAGFDEETGCLTSLKLVNDPLSTEYCANEGNLTYPSFAARGERLGDARLRVFENGGFTLMNTSLSADNRRVFFGERRVETHFSGPSARPGGICGFGLTRVAEMEEDALRLDYTLTNPGPEAVEIGEFSLSLMTNTEFEGIFTRLYPDAEADWHGVRQRVWHEQRLLQHLSLSGHNSYVLLRRPKGDYPAVLLLPAGDTAIETAYQMDPSIASQWSCTFEGPYYLSAYAAGARRAEGWGAQREKQRYWFGGMTSLMLAPGEERTLSFRLIALPGEEAMEREMLAADKMCLRAVPGMAAPENVPIWLAVRCARPVRLTSLDGDLRIDVLPEKNGAQRFRLRAGCPGQKRVLARFGGLESVLAFYFTHDPARMLDRRARFIARRQILRNSDDPFGRDGLFFSYDNTFDALFLAGDESWQVGGADELCLPPAMFLAEKNVLRPCRDQIDALERFVRRGLWGSGLQNPETYEIRRGLYWEAKTPSDAAYGGKWDERTSRTTTRAFNYTLLTCFFSAMHRIARVSDTELGAEKYLECAYRTCMKGFEVGALNGNGAPAGSAVVDFAGDLRRAAPEWGRALDARLRRMADFNATVAYPYGSELYTDQTAHDNVYALFRAYGHADLLPALVDAVLALRGRQPAWYQYGNDKRGNVCCWYATPMNSRLLMDCFFETGNRRAMELAMGGLSSFMTVVQENGAARGWFTWWPDRTGFDGRSLDSDMGLFAYLRAAAAVVCEDPDFGTVGYGCSVKRNRNGWAARIRDGVGRRLWVERPGGMVRVSGGSIRCARWDEKAGTLTIALSNARADARAEGFADARVLFTVEPQSPAAR